MIAEATSEAERLAEEKQRLEEHIQNLNIQLQMEEQERDRQKEIFIQDLDEQVETKKRSFEAERKLAEAAREKSSLANFTDMAAASNEVAANLANWDIQALEPTVAVRMTKPFIIPKEWLNLLNLLISIDYVDNYT